MPGVKTNEQEGTRAVLRHSRMSAYKVRQVLDQIRGQDVDRAAEILTLVDRDAAVTVGKLLASAVANAVHNDGMDAEELYVSACYADEGGTLKRWRPRARGRATRIRKRTSHITIIVSRLPEDRIARRRTRQAANAAHRSRRVAGSRRRQRAEAPPTPAAELDESPLEESAADDELVSDEEFEDLGEDSAEDAAVAEGEGAEEDEDREDEKDEDDDGAAEARSEGDDTVDDQHTDGESAADQDEKGE